MKKWWMSTVVVMAAVIATVVFAVANVLVHDPVQVDKPERGITALEPRGVDNTGLKATLSAMAQDKRLGNFGAMITDITTGEVVLSQNAETALTPASATKLLTAAAALYELGPEDRIVTEVRKKDRTVVIKGSGDVWLTHEQMDSLAAQIGTGVDTVLVDVTAWKDKLLPGWDPADVDAGFVAPLEPVMLYGGRLGATSGDVPRSHRPAFDVAEALAKRLGAGTVGYTDSAEGEVVAHTESPTLQKRISMMMEDSDNVMAEAIGRELSAEHPVEATLDVLRKNGVDVGGSTVVDNSGLSLGNQITPKLLNQVAAASVLALPVAGGTGTLENRFNNTPGAGWVRAKTGTLTGVSALAGVVPSKSGHVYSFAMISNGSEIKQARAALDAIANAVREA
ncbi:D-alanyl-D-alanine carboxypeptidase/D-alanyl-D-alanine-endopeptidase [Corynebacterium silvaticum]|uniref:D-alanyl-D-alanine carboxypeptidase/D-alanyl-D-alanine-endopeptidase n=1 Tax=Corynebacterium silvaticum TaxID=2320431 RepID=A0A7Y4P928_9CORY|nr:D-alanyl-D-alanine carboxypeptidase/D-alanyl-D-alanine-endopeptidase [Corynebacterium silvaticum]ARU46771.1 D-alanyl-D-alanine carboxypeptidase/D-alanyl-D-alanine-endopeptidase [Corynebacterium silvaticum]MBH5300842.1 D-alanyl-D-alanine carboxypeptidase/D-alanyl-D-alanine-endopeptidase [Corynebacterium silvaticum]NOM65040.1 D-alanyl-D-alanine carboxypeptidase/D-alanyl-D-alanine-endopeptidase [Corynebacterium silvaticum]NON70079.1 D-alanyl-D-alanine carboxypeptidase/D-alanyl-D-alanine-endopep